MKNRKTIERFIELRADGNSFDKISKELKVNKQTLINWSKKFETEIQNLKTINLDALLKEYQISKETRIKNLGAISKKLLEEATERKISDLPTEKLFKLIAEYHEIIRNEDTSLLIEDEDNMVKMPKAYYKI